MSRKRRLLRFVLGGLAALALLAIPDPANAQQGGDAAPGAAACTRTISAKVVALDQVFFWNRLGAVQPQGMMFALSADVVAAKSSLPLGAGNARLRDGKRPRPIVLRMNVGDCLQVTLFNYLNPDPVDEEQVVTRVVSLRAHGLQLRNSIADDGSFVGKNASSLVAVGGNRTYTFYAEREGSHQLYSMGSTTGGEGDGGQLNAGLFGSVNVQPTGAEWYRSQVTAADLKLATKGTTLDGHPIINYNACYPSGQDCSLTPDAKPILKMLKGTEIVHTDLTAIISGPHAGRFLAGTYPAVQVEPDRDQPFREFTIMYHDEIGAVQAFPQFEDPRPGEENPLKYTLHSVRDAFAINYGTGGIGAEILANRLGVGPMADCTECRYEEFFLTSWAVGDPAMVVDFPANVPCSIEDIRHGNVDCGPKLGFKATKAFYPDDPSNVYHTYIGDHTKFRVLHGGSKEHHIHHLHAHQWVHTPDDDNSAYLDSQALGPGSSFTTEITYNGSGNRNKVVGDSIFHCHFYPHFAMGMWALWRSHDVFESGTVLDVDGRPAEGSRAYPDAEILAGTPIPAIVPLPTRPMAPLPEVKVSIVNGQVQIEQGRFGPLPGNPGYPFFIPAIAGHRPPTPPLDVVDDGGLPRHVITGGKFTEVHDRLDFSKKLITANAVARREEGEPVELEAMKYHGQRSHATFTPEGDEAKFITNGLPRKTKDNPLGGQPGAPYADPCMDDEGVAVGVERFYKAAGIQLDVRLNKAGWHFPQQRILALWGDVADLRGTATSVFVKPPEPFFFRANTNDCITFYHTNLLPAVYALDDFQVRTPTDIIGQHIHLVKFDVTSSDGAGNGWNYEDGTLAPDEVLERIEAINAAGGLEIPPIGDGPILGGPIIIGDGPTIFLKLEPKAHPFFGTKGAQTTVQRWYADDTLNNNKVDRTLRTVFTHDHFGPSTHQQVGLYAGLVLEPEGSKWSDPDTGEILGGQGVPPPRFDGGPTSWRVDVETKDPAFSYREFMLEFADFQHAYLPGFGGTADNPHPDPKGVINPPNKKEDVLPWNIKVDDVCHGGFRPPCPEAISSLDPGTMVVNYRNEPIPLRIRDPLTNLQVVGEQGDLSHVFRSISRIDPVMNQHNAYPPFYAVDKDTDPTDPFTRLLRAYEHDRVQIRILVGAHEEGHNFTVHGIKWLFEPGTPEDPLAVNNSGYRNSQMMGISEHFEFIVPNMPNKMTDKTADYLYMPGASVDDSWNGMWGILRVFKGEKGDLKTLRSNTNARAPILGNKSNFDGVCLKTQIPRQLNVTAVLAQNILPQKTLVYNPRLTFLKNPNTGEEHQGPLHDPTAIMYVRSEDLDTSGKLRAGVPIEPLILRANAGDCIDVTLTNNLPATAPDLEGWNTLPMLIKRFNANQVLPSSHVGLHPQLVFFDVTDSNGFNVGFNPVQTAAPGFSVKYRWYAGDFKIDPVTSVGSLVPIEFGGTNLISSDPIKHSNKGAFGSLIILPTGKNVLGTNRNWQEDVNSRARATVYDSLGNAAFRDFVLMHQTDVNLRFGEGSTIGDGKAVPNLAGEDDAEDTAQKAFNYRTEPLWFRLGFMPDIPLNGAAAREEFGEGAFFSTRDIDFSNAVSNSVIPPCLSPNCKDPVTPIFTATAGQQARFHVLNAGGHTRNNVFVVHGHVWREEPYLNGSKTIGANLKSEWSGAQFGVGATFHFDALLRNGAGGRFKVTGDYLYRTFQSMQFHQGLWGIFRVLPTTTTDQTLLDPTPVP